MAAAKLAQDQAARANGHSAYPSVCIFKISVFQRFRVSVFSRDLNESKIRLNAAQGLTSGPKVINIDQE
ncbi:MAG: hypothetical protein H7A55_15170 [Verrucomicrobiaceae bacterium]|nr:hypothetical protein [Verrucomicrobiaceae bacterium]